MVLSTIRHPAVTSYRSPRRQAAVAGLLACTLAAPAGLGAQSPRPARPVPWSDVGLGAAGVLALVGLDAAIRHTLQDHRSESLDRFASRMRGFGEWPVYAATPVMLALTGLVANRPAITRAGVDAGQSALLTLGLVTALKHGFGRERPLCDCGPVTFEPMGPGRAFPSGHTAVAFAIATVIGDEIDRGWARLMTVSAASLVGWSRMNDDRHWLSDVVAGALVGTLSAKIATGRWRLGGDARPVVDVQPDGARLGVRLPL